MNKEQLIDRLHPVIRHWFRTRFGETTDIQEHAWRAISEGRHTLITAPTGSGKTLAAMLPCLDAVVRAKAGAAAAPRGVRILYVTPLKALNNDIHRHLFGFLREMEETAKGLGEEWPGIEVGVRTGDTSQSTRASMLKRPPDLLVTTPESLYLLLTSSKAREMLRTVAYVVVDEIHDMAADRRGVHLSLTLERLSAWCGSSPLRVGVSATQKPIERMARFLGGREETPESGEWQPRPVEIVESRINKTFEVRITMPEQLPLTRDRKMLWVPLVEKLLALMESSRSVIVYVVSRRMCERLAHWLNEHVGYELARPHHGSVSKEKRLEVERLLKDGELRCLIATSSLELGIDVGHVDLVLQVDSPKRASAAIQRIGRAGHAVGGVSRGVMVARSRGELAETAVLARAVVERDIEETRIPRNCLDVLAQQLIAMASTEEWTLDRLRRVVAGSDCYRDFPQAKLASMLKVLSGYYPFARPLLEWDLEKGAVRGIPASAVAALTGAGTIPQSSAFPVVHVETRLQIGELDEEFVQESRMGDVFQLGAHAWRINAIRPDRVYVSENGSGTGDVPFWRAEGPGRDQELGSKIGELYRRIEQAIALDVVPALRDELERDYRMDGGSAEELIAYVRHQHAVCAVPNDRRIVIERYRDDVGRHHVLVHSVFGKRLNRTWQIALQAHLEKTLRQSLYAMARDDGFELVLPEWDASWASLIAEVDARTLEPLLHEALAAVPMFGAAFRRIAETSLLLSRSFTRVPAWKKRMRSEDLLREALPFAADFPFLQEAMEVCLKEELDAEGLKGLFADIAAGRKELVLRETSVPSPFAARFLFDYANVSLYESDALGADVVSRLAGISRELAADWFGTDAGGVVDRELAEQERERMETDTMSALQGPDDLYRLLKERGDMTLAELKRYAPEHAAEWLEELKQIGKVTAVSLAGGERWICRDEKETYDELGIRKEADEFVLARFARGRLGFTAHELAARYGMPREEADRRITGWRERRIVERSPFADAERREELWTHSDTAARLIRLTLRRESGLAEERLDPVRLCLLLAEEHGISAGPGTDGMEGMRRAIGKLQGIYMPLSYWETILFPSRVPNYRKEYLDLLCASGEVFWVGRRKDSDKDKDKDKAAEGEIAFFLAESKELYAPLIKPGGESRHPELLETLTKLGASFLTALSRETGRLPSELTADLMDLVWEGRVSNDQFHPLRMSMARRAGKAGDKFKSGLGRWYALSGISAAGLEPERSAVGWVRHLLAQRLVLNRDWGSDASPFSWDTLAGVMRQLEEAGAVTRGFFVREARGLQYSAAGTLGRLRAPWTAVQADDVVVLPSIDPVNPFGLLTDWPNLEGASFARKPGNYLVFKGGEWAFWVEAKGKKVFRLPSTGGHSNRRTEESEREPVAFFCKTIMMLEDLRKLKIEQWDGHAASESAEAVRLLGIGAERDGKGLVLWRSAIKL